MQHVGLGNGAELLLEQMKQILPKANQNLLTIDRLKVSTKEKHIFQIIKPTKGLPLFASFQTICERSCDDRTS